ncbi:MAG TPA: response regulator [Candidatus Dormibacteraeota bacterium]|nr:response regulator [Candidatus Dormibacteraeota bacterium]
MRFNDVVNLLAANRDQLILALSVLVLVEGGIIVLWARRSSRLRQELVQVAAAADAARVAAERAAAAVSAAPSRRPREVYAVAARSDVAEAPPAETAATATAPVVTEPATAPSRWTPPAPPAVPAEPAWTPLAAAPPAPQPAADPEPVEAAAPPAEPVSPAAEKAAAWMLPEVEAGQTPDVPAASNGSGNGHAPSAPNGWVPAPTTMGWSASAVPVEPAADFAVVRDSDTVAPAAPAAPEKPAGNGGAPTLTVLDGTRTWSFPAASAAPVAPPPAPTHFDPALLDGGDDTFVDDAPPTGDILLVEDDPTIAKLYRVLLESRGYTVRHAGDGLEGLERAAERRPDLVLLDIMMPRMNGIAFLQALRGGEMRDLPVVVLSNFMEKQLVDDAMSLGALEYMVKAQTRPEALVGALPHWLRGERAFSF